MQVAAQSLHIFRQIRNLGIKIAIDDFGTGYSSFGSLKQIKLDVLKIDKLFIKDITTDETDSVIVQAMIKLAEALGMSTTAEGIEYPEQLELVKRMGCHEYQGFYFSKPLPIHELETLIRQTNR